MFERHQGGEVAVLVHVEFTVDTHLSADLHELHELALSAGAELSAVVTAAKAHPDAKYFVGSGKAENIREVVASTKADLVIVNHTLTPAQERNLEKLVQCRVLDRTGLILDIFAQRASTHEGKLQVELAQLRYMSTRLIRGWTHLERQKGGIGLRGPGETQLELDRRMLRDRIKQINKRLEKVRHQRALGRQARQRSSTPLVSLVGYTNAGKSTLFNHLTSAAVYAADQLFATLDPTLRQVAVPHLGKVIMADTVGFIRHLPHDVVEAFRATLEETIHADLLLHVVDASDPEHEAYMEQVMQVLDEVDAKQKSILTVMNKIDIMPDAKPRIDYDAEGVPWRVWVSAEAGLGMGLLFEALAIRLSQTIYDGACTLLPAQGKLRAALYEAGAVINENVDTEGNIKITLKCPQRVIEQIGRDVGLSKEAVAVTFGLRHF